MQCCGAVTGGPGAGRHPLLLPLPPLGIVLSLCVCVIVRAAELNKAGPPAEPEKSAAEQAAAHQCPKQNNAAAFSKAHIPGIRVKHSNS
jgi:hypothetical protein